jgi:hypothetical protein
MSGSPKEKLQQETEPATTTDDRELYLRDGRKVVVNDSGTEPLVEIRSESGLLELRIKLTEEGPVLQMESVRMQLKATESVSIESKQVEIKATEQLALAGKDVGIEAEQNVEVDANKDVRVRSGVDDDAEPGTHGNIYLN